MVILRVRCDNLYMFKNFELDLTHEQRATHPFLKDDSLFVGSRIKVRKNLIIMGKNSSGKTTFGKLLCLILNFIHGKNLDDTPFDLKEIQYDTSKDASFEVEFAIKNTAYLLKAVFHDLKLFSEELRMHEIRKSYNIVTLREKLNVQKPVHAYDAITNLIDMGFKSYIFSALKDDDIATIKNNNGFWFRFEAMFDPSVKISKIDMKLVGKILPQIDNSIRSVQPLSVKGDDKTEINDYRILFKNQKTLTVPDGDIEKCLDRLSYGTVEAIDFVYTLDAVNKKIASVFYIDERLAHLHSELEAYLIWQTFCKKEPTAQIFFTTHNVEILELNLPITSFVFFNCDDNGFVKAMYPSSKLRKTNVSLRSYYENDYFGVLPDYSILDHFFEE